MYCIISSPMRIAALLRRVHATLAPAGVLLLRVGDAAGGLRFRAGLWWDRAVMLARGYGWVRLHCRSVAEWRALLLECGFDSQVMSMPVKEHHLPTRCCARGLDDTTTVDPFHRHQLPGSRAGGDAGGARGRRAAVCRRAILRPSSCRPTSARSRASTRAPAAALQRFDCRNNRLAQLGLMQDGFDVAVRAAIERLGQDASAFFSAPAPRAS
jgi:hypothetical protein